MSTTYLVKVITPCQGQQLVTQQGPTFYAGNSGNFDFAQVARPSTATQWAVNIYEYTNPSSPCYPSKQFKQVTPNASDPRGPYQGVDSSGNLDPAEGEANVEDWP